MTRWLTAAVCGLVLLACSPDTSSPQSAPAAAATSRLTPSRTPGPAPETTEPTPSALPAPVGSADLRCLGKRPTIVGTPADDRIRAIGREDVIISLGGDDVITGINDRDTVCTGTGSDRVIDEKGGRAFVPLHVKLGDGDDQMTVADYGGVIRAGRGDDTIVVGRSADATVSLGAGDDLIRTVPVRGDFIPTLDLCVRFQWATGPVRVNLARGRAIGEGRDRLVNIRCAVGSRFNDVLIGTDRSDGFDAGGGLDVVYAGAGHDDVDAGARADSVYLGPGADEGDGDAGWDRLYGGPGADNITGGVDGDYLDGGAGDDCLYSGWGCFDVWESEPYLMIEMMTGNAPNEVFGRAGNDFLAGERGNDRLDGGTGFDAGTGGYRDGRIDWIESLERDDECENPRPGSPAFL